MGKLLIQGGAHICIALVTLVLGLRYCLLPGDQGGLLALKFLSLGGQSVCRLLELGQEISEVVASLFALWS